MKLITAIIPEAKLDEVREALHRGRDQTHHGPSRERPWPPAGDRGWRGKKVVRT